MNTRAAWVTTPENRLARAAVERVITCLAARRRPSALNPLLLHGPAGTGKTHLVNTLAAEAIQRRPDLVVCVVSADEWSTPDGTQDETVPGDCDLLIVEDVHALRSHRVEAMIRTIDERRARGRQTVITAAQGPGQLTHLPARLTSRLACGLVVGLEPLSPLSRRQFLSERSRQRGLNVPLEVIGWLADHVGASARQLEGALNRLQTLTSLDGQAQNVATLAEQFCPDVTAARPSMERIIERVGRYFRVEPEQLCARGRGRNALLPRQVGMYLARQLTPLSLEQIGASFGGRDHSTVLHACRKVEQALVQDTALAGAVRQLHADLG
jgi:chromosomal replication initiator protein